MIAWRGVIPIERVPAAISRDKATNWIGVGGHVVHYPLRVGTPNELRRHHGAQRLAGRIRTTEGTANECAR